MSGDILIAAAVPDELAAVRAELSAARTETVGGRRLDIGRLSGRKVRLMATGPGIFNTVQGLTAAVESCRPAMVIMGGTAGAFARSGLGVGDLAVAIEEIDVHLGIESPENEAVPSRLPFPIIQRPGLEIYRRCPLDRPLAERCRQILDDRSGRDAGRVATGPFLTVATVTASDKRAEALYHAFAPCMESMEGMGGALTAVHYGLPLVEIRSASNLVGRRQRERWDLPLAAARLGQAILDLVTDLPPPPVDDAR